MLRAPSGRRKVRGKGPKLNLVPILDAVFIFIFFLLMSASFLNLYEISSDVPIISTSESQEQEKPLGLTLIITDKGISIATGIPSKIRASFGKNIDGRYDLEGLRNFLFELKKQFVKENTAIFEPQVNLDYGTLIEIMDAVRLLRNTDEDIFYKDKDGVDRKVEVLFNNIIFGNILS